MNTIRKQIAGGLPRCQHRNGNWYARNEQHVLSNRDFIVCHPVIRGVVVKATKAVFSRRNVRAFA